MIAHLINANWCIDESWDQLVRYDSFEINMSYFEAFVSRHIDSIFDSQKASVTNGVYGLSYQKYDVYVLLCKLHSIALEIKEAAWKIQRQRLYPQRGAKNALSFNVVH